MGSKKEVSMCRLERFARAGAAMAVSAAAWLAVSIASGAAWAQQPPDSETNRLRMDAVIEDYLERNPEIIQRIVRDYITSNPLILQDGIAALIRKGGANAQAKQAESPQRAAAITANAQLLFASPRQVTLGNADGDVTLVEFFDYNCGFCKRAASDKLELIRSDARLRVVLKELPVLGPDSREAAAVAVAVRMQNAGSRYLAFHQVMMSNRGRANKATALKAAGEAGFDVARIERDLASAEVMETLEETQHLAAQLGITGTPSYVVGNQVVVGAVGLAKLGERIGQARR